MLAPRVCWYQAQAEQTPGLQSPLLPCPAHHLARAKRPCILRWPCSAEYSSFLSDFLDSASLHNLTAVQSVRELAQAVHGMEDSFCTPEK